VGSEMCIRDSCPRGLLRLHLLPGYVDIAAHLAPYPVRDDSLWNPSLLSKEFVDWDGPASSRVAHDEFVRDVGERHDGGRKQRRDGGKKVRIGGDQRHGYGVSLSYQSEVSEAERNPPKKNDLDDLEPDEGAQRIEQRVEDVDDSGQGREPDQVVDRSVFHVLVRRYDERDGDEKLGVQPIYTT